MGYQGAMLFCESIANTMFAQMEFMREREWVLNTCMAEHLLRDGAGGGAGRGDGRVQRADVARPQRAEDRSRRLRAVDGGDRAADLHDHRGAGIRLGQRAQRRRLRGGRGAAGGVHRMRAQRARADARREPVPQPALRGGERLGDDRVLRAVRRSSS